MNRLWHNRKISEIYSDASRFGHTKSSDLIDLDNNDKKYVDLVISSSISKAMEDLFDYLEFKIKDDTIDLCGHMNSLSEEEQIKEIDKDEGMYEYIFEPSMSVKNYHNFKYKL